ncbi:HAE1 family hydrophobic/amphiphilic exporter-1 [Salsuginibacillus halophilus]|uniref:HAE1 family hydrophobic/amphiphilic exporter-1 n=1 Tax=Salsuginibacillus halophilus TaxID=517424 RepID=A0A2P8HAK6_9BACI|nr:efflux RND transporter permease subunit [Salsuginibacillus halophilus]PSL43263.1 HAE1 family hydrophobic/amphiphilic exporter-1 [Salsuginibacillus halophilus]
MAWLRLLLQRKLIVGLFIILVLFLGRFGLTEMDVEIMPDIDLDMAVVSVPTSDLSVLDVEEQVTDPIEDQIAGIDGVDDYTSETSAGNVSFTVMLENEGSDDSFRELETAMTDMTQLPAVEDISTFRFGTSGAELFLEVYGGDAEEMSRFTEEVAVPRLSALTEVGSIDVSGLQELEAVVTIDEEALQENELSLTEIQQAIQQQNENATLGSLAADEGDERVRWDTSIDGAEALEQVSMQTPEGVVALQDVADVEILPAENGAAAWKNGSSDVISLQIESAGDVGEIELTETVRAEMAQMHEEDYVSGFAFEELISTADFIQSSIDSIQQNVVIGGLLALVVLALFTLAVRPTIIIGISIPLSIMLTFAAMWFLDYSINMLTLIALGLGIGMMVDSAIVIFESIYRKVQQGIEITAAIIHGTKEVATAVIAAMLTTVVVLLPLAIMSGDIGEFIMMLAMVVILTLLSSLLVSFTVIPVLSSQLLKKTAQKAAPRPDGRLKHGYGRMINWVTAKKLRSIGVLAGFIALFFASIFLIERIPMSAMPDVYDRETELMMTLDSSADHEAKEAIAMDVNEQLQDVPDVTDNTVTMFEDDMMWLLINMTDEEDATMDQSEINAEIFNALTPLEDDHPIEAVMSAADGGMSEQSALTLQVYGDDYEAMAESADRLEEELSSIDGVININHNFADMTRENALVFDDEELNSLDLTAPNVRSQIEPVFMREEIDQLSVSYHQEVPVYLAFSHEVDTLEALLDHELNTSEGGVPLSEVASFKETEMPVAISRENGERVASVTADLDGQDLGTVNRELQDTAEEVTAATDTTVQLGGALEQQQEAMTEILFVLGIAVLLVYIVMAVQFNSFIHPLVVVSILPFTFVGVILGLLITQMELNMIAAMGVVMLVGIVLNNAILLIDRLNKLRTLEGMNRPEALMQAGKDRMRPIFLTTFTTIAGMLPLALAVGGVSDFQAPMATVVISGLLFATLVTLIIIPIVYVLLEDTLHWPRKLWRKRQEKRLAKKAAPEEEAG